MWYSGAGGKLIHEKNRKQKISWHCPFKYIIKNVQGRVLDEEGHLAELQLELEPFQQALDTHR